MENNLNWLENRKVLSLEETKKITELFVKFVNDNAGAKAIRKTFEEKFKDFLLNGVDVNTETYFILNKLIETNNKVCLKMYLQAGANANVKSTFNVTPLFGAMFERQKNAYNFCYLTMLEYGADLFAESTMFYGYKTPMSVLDKIDLTDIEKQELKRIIMKLNKKADELTDN